MEKLDLATIAVGLIVGSICAVSFYILGRIHDGEKHLEEIYLKNLEIEDLAAKIVEMQGGEKAAKFRVRTESGNTSNKKTTVRKARIRAFRSITPPPRK